jgi:hypothetical protein
MTNPFDDIEKTFEELQGLSDQIEVELALEQIASQSMIELKHIEMHPIFDEYYGSFVFQEVLVKGSKKPVLKDPKGGLTAAGRAYFKRKEGASLKPGVRGAADTPEKMRRKGSFLTRFFTNPSGPMKDEKGRATRLALSASAWGEPVPQNIEDAKKLAAKGRRMLERYQNSKSKKSHFSYDYFNKFSPDSYNEFINSEELKGLIPPDGMLFLSESMSEEQQAIRASLRRNISELAPSSKTASQSYVSEDSEELKRMSKAAKMMKQRRKAKQKNG